MRVLDDEVLGVLFTEARTHRKWLDRPVDDATLRRVYELARWPPTSANSEPLRLVFV
jgi:3-hydroxypropanoate dehydrogenase